MQKSWIGLLDCNNFFVSCERLFRPDLAGKPVVVLSSNDGCVVARSQEIKDMGIRMGVPYFEIKDTLKKASATTFSSHFALYRDISRRVFTVMQNELHLIEQYSIDEAFFALDNQAEETAWRVKKAVEQQVGIPVSIGLAATKTQAKHASSLAKKSGGVCVLKDADWQALAPNIQLANIWGVGGKLGMKYKAHKLITVEDLLQADSARIANIFGVVGVRLQQELAGQSVLKFHQKTEPQQSLMSTRSFKNTTTDISVLADAIAYHVRHAAADLRSQKQEASLLRVSILPSRHGDFLLRGGTKEVIFNTPTSDTLVFLQAAKTALEDLYEPAVPYKKAGITLAGLRPIGSSQGQLFSTRPTNKSGVLMEVIDKLNGRTGRELVVCGSRLQTNHWQSRSESCSPAYTTRWSDIIKVQAE